MNEYNSGPGGGEPYRPQEGGGYHNPQAGHTGGQGGGYSPPPPREPEQPYSYNYGDYDDPGHPRPEGPRPDRKGKKGLAVFFSIVAVILGISLLSFTGYSVYVIMTGNNFLYEGGTSEPAASAPKSPAPDSPQLNIAGSPAGGVTLPADGSALTDEQIAAKVSPATVRITNYQADTPYGVAGEGTGIVMSSDGYIVTNHHVVDGATGLQVTLSDNESYNARLIGSDKLTDLAVIKLEATPMPALAVAEFGDSDELKLGEHVVAIGNAGGSEFAGTVTGGMISGLDRQITTESGSRMTVLQTDAAINPGNSGGPLINRYGQVVGINSAKYTAANYEGIGFAIPISHAKPIIDDLIQNGRVTGRPRLGVQTYPYFVDSSTAPYLGLPRDVSGVRIVGIDSECDVAKKGIVVGDVIMSIDGHVLESTNDLQNYIVSGKKPGDTVELELYRPASQRSAAGRTYTVSVILAEDTGETNFPEQQQEQQQIPDDGEDDYGGYFPGFPFFPFG